MIEVKLNFTDREELTAFIHSLIFVSKINTQILKATDLTSRQITMYSKELDAVKNVLDQIAEKE